jgi:hypothetical protein
LKHVRGRILLENKNTGFHPEKNLETDRPGPNEGARLETVNQQPASIYINHRYAHDFDMTSHAGPKQSLVRVALKDFSAFQH